MLSLLSARKWVVICGLLLTAPFGVWGQTVYTRQAGEYRIAGGILGDQTGADLAINAEGGYLVWQDNYIDGQGLGIGAVRLDRNFNSVLGVFRINQHNAGDQQKPRALLLKNGGVVFVWQGGEPAAQRVWARFMGPNGTFATGDVTVSGEAVAQVTPAVAAFSDGSVIVVWSSYGLDGSMQGVFGQRISATGEKLGSPFQVNQFTIYNQRDPAVAVLANQSFVVVWASEQQRGDRTVDIYGRIYSGLGVAQSDEIRLSGSDNICANPMVVGLGNGHFRTAWSERDAANVRNGWDVVTRLFDGSGAALGAAAMLNTYRVGDQYGPQVAVSGDDAFVVWTSVGQDGSREGIFGRVVGADGSMGERERLVNATHLGRQFQPGVAADGTGRFLVVWSSYAGGPQSFDLFAQRYAAEAALAEPSVPFVSALSQSRLGVAWPPLGGYEGVQYLLYVDDSATPVTLSEHYYSLGQLSPSSMHTFRLGYQLSSGAKSALSAPASGKTWGPDDNFDGIPDDWQVAYWGAASEAWPAGGVDSDGDGASNLKEFLAGTNPKDAASVLRTRFLETAKGLRLEWNTEPGFVYQAQVSRDIVDWANLGRPRFAAGASDSVLVSRDSDLGYYRVIRLR